MKKLLSFLMIAMLAVMPMAAKDRVSRNVADLPQGAQMMLKKYFPKKAVSHIKIDTNILGNRDYDVILVDGSEVEFDSAGNWEEVDCGLNAVPASLVPVAIKNYVAANYKGQKIVKISKEHNKYEIELRNGLDLKFDGAGNFLKID